MDTIQMGSHFTIFLKYQFTRYFLEPGSSLGYAWPKAKITAIPIILT